MAEEMDGGLQDGVAKSGVGGSHDDTPPNDLDAASLDLENGRLQHHLASLRSQRRQAREMHQQQEDLYASLQDKLNLCNLEQEQALLDFRSAVYQNRRASSLLKVAQQWSVISDCFQISHRGPFGTINGLRLGAEAPNEDLSDLSDDCAAAPTAATRRPFALMEPRVAPSPSIRVPWIEINAALGHVALLLATLESRPHVGITLRHTIVPMGSYSKVGIRRGDSVSLYNLYSDDSFQFFGKRNFNTALQCLVECVVDAAEAIQKCDRTIAVPHVIDKQRDAITVGGLSIAYGAEGIEWTRAMKYVLTDIKHLMTYRALSLWDP
jgi:beclin 1